MIHTVVRVSARDTKYGFTLNKQRCNFKRKHQRWPLYSDCKWQKFLACSGRRLQPRWRWGSFLLLEVLVGLFQLVLVDGEVLLHLGELLLEIADFLVDLGAKTDLVLGHQYIIEPFVLLSLSLTDQLSNVRNVDYVLYLVRFWVSDLSTYMFDMNAAVKTRGVNVDILSAYNTLIWSM